MNLQASCKSPYKKPCPKGVYLFSCPWPEKAFVIFTISGNIVQNCTWWMLRCIRNFFWWRLGYSRADINTCNDTPCYIHEKSQYRIAKLDTVVGSVLMKMKSHHGGKWYRDFWLFETRCVTDALPPGYATYTKAYCGIMNHIFGIASNSSGQSFKLLGKVLDYHILGSIVGPHRYNIWANIL